MKKKDKDKQAIYRVSELMKSEFDVSGSYTGVPSKGEKPVQDADDL